VGCFSYGDNPEIYILGELRRSETKKISIFVICRKIRLQIVEEGEYLFSRRVVVVLSGKKRPLWFAAE